MDEAATPTAEDTGSPLLRRILALGARAGLHARNGQPQAAEILRLCEALLSERGEVSGARAAAELITAFRALDAAGRDTFFGLLSDAFVPDPEEAAQAAAAYRASPASETLLRLQAAVEPLRQELFRRLNLAPGGTGALIDMRQQLLTTLRQHPERRALDADFVHLFRSWFNGGFLTLRRIDWRTSAVVLERLIQYEAVHQIQGWDDLHRRLEADRRCYAFFHAALPDEPLIFIEVALTERMSAHIRPLLDPRARVLDPARARSAVFYSITHCLEGLRGVSFGSLLIKQVVEDLRRSFPKMKTFATLSPIPDFRRWLGTSGMLPAHAALEEFLARAAARAGVLSEQVPAEVHATLVRLCAYYLMHARQGKVPFDPVARFHLANGARLERLNWLADPSAVGIRRSFGLMANYVYRLDDLERNHEAYAREHQVIASREIERLAARRGRTPA
ncbi:MAG: malonyl-CoA decarboxylase [Acidobacteria bacterium]|nr:malonyl-CoA decarboxylase [Acidobacteriota bacterium]